MEIEEIEAKVIMIAKDCENLISELENARLIDSGEILVRKYKDVGVTGYIGYESFSVFCQGLINKYLRKPENLEPL